MKINKYQLLVLIIGIFLPLISNAKVVLNSYGITSNNLFAGNFIAKYYASTDLTFNLVLTRTWVSGQGYLSGNCTVTLLYTESKQNLTEPDGFVNYENDPSTIEIMTPKVITSQDYDGYYAKFEGSNALSAALPYGKTSGRLILRIRYFDEVAQKNVIKYAATRYNIIIGGSNDNYANARNLVIGTDIVSGSTINATSSIESITPCSSIPIYDDVWYKFVATNNTHIIDLSNVNYLYDGYQYGIPHSGIALYDSNLGYMDCNIGGGRLGATSFIVGQTYYVRLWSATVHTNVRMSYRISVAASGANAILGISRSGGYSFTASYSLIPSIPLSDVAFEWSADPGETNPATNYTIEQGQSANQIYLLAGDGEGDTTVRLYVRMRRISTGELITSWTAYPSLIWF